MKARVIATGDIVEATLRHGENGKLWYEIDKSGYFLTDEELDFSFERESDYWTKLKHQYAGMAMQSYINNNVYMREVREMCKTPNEMREMVADLSILLATTLVEKLKEKEERI